MKHNNKIRQEFRNKENSLVMQTDTKEVAFNPKYVLWLEDELNKSRINVVRHF